MNVDQIVNRLRETGWHIDDGGERQLRLVLAEAGAVQETVQGVPLWDWYAGMALQGILSGPTAETHLNYTGDAADYADKMMEARKGRE